MAQEQLPAEQYAVGGQTEIANYVVISEVDGFEEDTEAKQTAAGQHKCDITYSRRATKSLTLELLAAADATDYVSGGGLDATYGTDGDKVWEIRSVQRVNTRGPIQLQLELVSLVDTIAA